MKNRYWITLLIISCSVMACATQPSERWQSDHYSDDGIFYNTVNTEEDFSAAKFMAIVKRFVFERHPNTEPFGLIPIQPIDINELNQQQDDVVYRLGHSTVLMKLSGQYILTDPMFSQRTSPVQWAGPKRFHDVPLDLDKLPNIHTVVISHDHYDHLDQGSIERLAPITQHFVVPLGIGQYLLSWGVASEKIYEMDWWQSKQLGAFTFTSTPSQHFSGRGLFQRNRTLWSSWVIDAPKHRLFFSGDTGYFDGFKTIGEKYGPFDLTIMENGAYNPDWANVHMFPAETIQAHIDLKGNAMLPVHNGTFKLAFHHWKAPLEQVSALGEKKGLHVYTPKMGEPIRVDQENLFEKWWSNIVDEE